MESIKGSMAESGSHGLNQVPIAPVSAPRPGWLGLIKLSAALKPASYVETLCDLEANCRLHSGLA